VVFDQMRADYLTRWESLFGDEGIRRLQKDGAWFRNCHYPYAATWTAAGHASLLTGCSPRKHGIIGNDWYERASGATVSCVGSDRYQRVPARGAPARENGDGRPERSGRGASPERLLVPSLGDVLVEATGGKARVVSLSLKDRSAVFPGGRHAAGCYWMDMATGSFVTSTYYRERLHPWVAEFNAGKPADRWFGQDWTWLRADLDYERHSGPDDVAAEGIGVFQGRTFPHPMTGGLDLKVPTPLYYQALYNSPFGNELLLALAERAIAAEQLGARETADLLCVSFSSNDPIGHCWGPDSQEVLDVTLRSDRIVKELLAYLDARVGRGWYVLALTSDHGVCPIPEVARGQGKDAGRIAPAVLGSQAEEFLRTRFGKEGDKARWIEATAEDWIYLDQDTLKKNGVPAADAEPALAGWLKNQTGVRTAYTRTQLTRGLPKDDAIGQAVLRSFHPGRCGDVCVVPKPYYLLSSYLTGTTHGTPYAYDTHVPLLVYGPAIAGGTRREPVTPLAVAAIFAHVLGIKPPSDAEVPVPRELFRSPAAAER
jgi:hypothetical protein